MDRIVVGMDGSSGAAAALRWALDESDRRDGVPVLAVMAWSYLDQRHTDPDAPFDPDYGEEQAAAVLAAAVEAVAGDRPVEQAVVNDLPAKALLERAGTGDLVVVGARGLGGFRGLLLGSVTERLLESVEDPVAVIREDAPGVAGGPVVAGVDGSDVALAALRWAVDAARARRSALRVVCGWQVPVLAAASSGRVLEAAEEGAVETVREALAAVDAGGLEVETRTPVGPPARVLLDAAEDASLMVVGSRGLGKVSRALLGSTSRQLASHAPCPLVVIPGASR